MELLHYYVWMTTYFIMVKARVVLLKQLTFPKLGLIAVLTAARLSSFITDTLLFCNCSVNLWTDSHHWIKGEKRNNAFVIHCITENHSITDPNCWRYGPTLSNSADCLTRVSVQLKWDHQHCGSINHSGYHLTPAAQSGNLSLLSHYRHYSYNNIIFHFACLQQLKCHRHTLYRHNIQLWNTIQALGSCSLHMQIPYQLQYATGGQTKKNL